MLLYSLCVASQLMRQVNSSDMRTDAAKYVEVFEVKKSCSRRHVVIRDILVKWWRSQDSLTRVNPHRTKLKMMILLDRSCINQAKLSNMCKTTCLHLVTMGCQVWMLSIENLMGLTILKAGYERHPDVSALTSASLSVTGTEPLGWALSAPLD